MTTDLDDEQFEQVAQSLEHWLAAQAADDIPELVLVGLLQGYADVIETHGYVPRSWRSPESSRILESRDSVSEGRQ
ncbi:hypothetical protein SAMN05216559_1780 [Halomicrobium zhouii]|uniref:Uncharacterized protein n=1 Tax=Halomicrobium zhouii TaxID=767519 RepID=A0A1I6L0X9_9EURY|nr:hypothetical protein [Halomicrobium zhouii]SFR97115.1 hypothetical protein SAMN05216559_1780 [Halomicrobium zhouii]